jgi:hypothetical protein
MSKFYSKITDALNETSLKRVNITHPGNYTGYKLEESIDGRAIVFVVSGEKPEHINQMVSVEPEQYSEIQPDNVSSPLDILKHTSVEYLAGKGLINCTDQDKLKQLMECPCVHAVEKYLRGYNITDTEIISILKTAIS